MNQSIVLRTALLGLFGFATYLIKRSHRQLPKRKCFLQSVSTFEIIFDFLKVEDLIIVRKTNKFLKNIVYNKAEPYLEMKFGYKPFRITMFKNYRLCVRTGGFTATDATINIPAKLYSLSVISSCITDVGISRLNGLKALILINNENLTHRCIESHPSLTYLECSGYGRNNSLIRGISALTNLKILELRSYDLKDICTCDNLSNLTSLSLLNCKNFHLLLPSLTNLKDLSLFSMEMTDLKQITNTFILPKLRSFKAGPNRFYGNFSRCIDIMPNLTQLHYRVENDLTDSDLIKLTKLETLQLPIDRTITESSLSRLLELRELDISSNKNITAQTFEIKIFGNWRSTLHRILKN